MTAVYSSLYQAQQQLNGIMAIDYFLAHKTSQQLIERKNTPLDESDLTVFFHSCILVSVNLREGHTCVDLLHQANALMWQHPLEELALPAVREQDLENDAEQRVGSESGDFEASTGELIEGIENTTGFQFPCFRDWSAALQRCGITPDSGLPLVYDCKRFYLRRYWQYETELAKQIKMKMKQKPSASLSNGDMRLALEPLFKFSTEKVDWQKIAVANSLVEKLAIICGGPGTGKTTTVVRLLAALLIVNNNSNDSLIIKMVAPTGKAAQRLSESILSAKQKLKSVISNDIVDLIPDKASTIHRLLGVRPDTHKLKYHADNQIKLDVLLLDEASMVDLPMMTKLFRAVSDDTQVIMLGDSNQLPSVAAGSVLADLAPSKHPGYSDDKLDYLENVCEYAKEKDQTIANEDAILSANKAPLLVLDNNSSLQKKSNTDTFDYYSLLEKSYRFDGSSGIGVLSAKVIEGEIKSSFNLLESQVCENNIRYDDISYINCDELSDEAAFLATLKGIINTYIAPVFSVKSVKQAFSILNDFRLLCAIRKTERGVEALNDTIESMLKKQGLLKTSDRASSFNSGTNIYHGKPIMISENNPRQQLFNGDVGLLWENEGKLMAAFEQVGVGDDGIRWYSIARLPKYETVYAMTIHKTQGSEFSHVAMILPNEVSPILSRELIYTGITRAKKSITVISKPKVWRYSVSHRVARFSGLSDRMRAGI